MRKGSSGMIRESISMSFSNIMHNRMRSFLTVLGIVIGVTAIIALITIIQGVTVQITDQFDALGTGKLIVRAGGTPLKRGLSPADVENLYALDYIDGVEPTVSTTASVLADGTWLEDVSIEGTNEVYFRKTKDPIDRGRALNILDVENVNRVALIDQKLMEKLFLGVDPLGKNVYISGVEYTIVGILSDAGDADVMAQAMGGSSDGKLIIPYTAALKQTGAHNITSLNLYVSDVAYTSAVVDSLEASLESAFNYKDDSYSIINMESLVDTLNTMMGMMTGLLAGIASIALLVGGIGIMNMMLVSVTERTTEIGLRKALGAEPGQIQLQFLIESFILSVLGGLLGLILGLVISWIFSAVIGTTFAVSAFAIALGVGFSAGVGIIFGWTPARKASNLNPIDALRSV